MQIFILNGYIKKIEIMNYIYQIIYIYNVFFTSRPFIDL